MVWCRAMIGLRGSPLSFRQLQGDRALLRLVALSFRRKASVLTPVLQKNPSKTTMALQFEVPSITLVHIYMLHGKNVIFGLVRSSNTVSHVSIRLLGMQSLCRKSLLKKSPLSNRECQLFTESFPYRLQSLPTDRNHTQCLLLILP